MKRKKTRGVRSISARYLDFVVRSLEGKESNSRVAFLEMLGSEGYCEKLAYVLSRPRKGELFPVRRRMEDIALMLGQIARRINSLALSRVVKLRMDLVRLIFTGDGKATKDEASRLAREFVDCHDFVITEISFMDARDRADIWATAPVRPLDLSGEYEVFYPQKGMTPDEATRESRAMALRNHNREMEAYGIPEKIASLTKSFSRLADMAAKESAPSLSDVVIDDASLTKILLTNTNISYIRFFKLDWWLRDDDDDYDVPPPDGDDEFVTEPTSETGAKERLGQEIERYINAAIILSKRIGSKSEQSYSKLKLLFGKHGMFYKDGVRSESDLDMFVKTLKSARERLHADVSAAKLGGEQPMKVELTKKSGETIAKAVRPGRGGARRMFDEDIQEKCWRYWETGRKNSDVAQVAHTSGRKLRREDVFSYYRRELAALDPPIDSPEAFKSALRARINRLSRSQTRKKSR